MLCIPSCRALDGLIADGFYWETAQRKTRGEVSAYSETPVIIKGRSLIWLISRGIKPRTPCAVGTGAPQNRGTEGARKHNKEMISSSWSEILTSIIVSKRMLIGPLAICSVLSRNRFPPDLKPLP